MVFHMLRLSHTFIQRDGMLYGIFRHSDILKMKRREIGVDVVYKWLCRTLLLVVGALMLVDAGINRV